MYFVELLLLNVAAIKIKCKPVMIDYYRDICYVYVLYLFIIIVFCLFQAAYAELVILRVRTLAVGLYTKRLNNYEFVPRPWS